MKLVGVLEVGALTVILLGLMARVTQRKPRVDMRDEVSPQR